MIGLTFIAGVLLYFEDVAFVQNDLIVGNILVDLGVVGDEFVLRNAELSLAEVHWVVGTEALMASIVVGQDLLLRVDVVDVLQLGSALDIALSYDVVIGLDAEVFGSRNAQVVVFQIGGLALQALHSIVRQVAKVNGDLEALHFGHVIVGD